MTLGAKGRDTSAAAALTEAGALAGGLDTAFTLADAFFADFFFGALFLLEAFFLPAFFGAAFRFAPFFFPAAFFFADFLRFAPAFLRAGCLRPAGLRLLFLRAAMCSLPRDAGWRRVGRDSTQPAKPGASASLARCASR